MTIGEVIAQLRSEKEQCVPSRFPCRAIMVNDIRQYVDLLSELRKLPNIEFLPSSEICMGDVMPQYNTLTGETYRNRWLVLTGVSEYLRLFGKSEAEVHRFAQLWHHQFSVDSIGRIVIPLWGCAQQWHDRDIGLQNDLRQKTFYFDCTSADRPDQRLDYLILSEVFQSKADAIADDADAFFYGLRELFSYWEKPMPGADHFVLITKRHRSIQPVVGNVNVRIIDSMLSFLKENLSGGNILTEENCPAEVQRRLFKDAVQGASVQTAILNALNLVAFDGISLMSKWKTMQLVDKQLVCLWMRLYPDGSYLHHCFNMSDSLTEITNRVLMEIFRCRAIHPEWVNESQQLVSAMDIAKTDEFFEALDQTPTYEERLQYLDGNSKEERIYLLWMIGKWMREDVRQVLECEMLRTIYPQLHAYLDPSTTVFGEELAGYFSRYKAYKLENTLPDDEDTYFGNVVTDTYPARYQLLHDAIDDDTLILWIDALGAEWLPLLIWSLKENIDSKIASADVACALLPTVTEYNDQWKQMDVAYEKRDMLDKLAHNGVIDEPSYYACVENQISFINNIANEVNKLLMMHHRVIITGDHGTSRLAARFFHIREGELVPPNAVIFSHGRYCRLADAADNLSSHLTTVRRDGEVYAVFHNYDHFKRSGFATGVNDEEPMYGELHGGASPEEVLVPVVVVDSKKEVALTAKWQSDTIKIRLRKVTATISFSKPIKHLEVTIDAVEAEVAHGDDDKTWSLVFSGIDKGTYPVMVKADGKLISVSPLTVLSALGEEDDFS